MSDMKWEIGEIADQMAEDEYQKDFYALPEVTRNSIWAKAELEWANRRAE